MSSSQRSSSESVLSADWITEERPDELGIVLFTFKNSDDSARKKAKRFVQRCKSNPEGRWKGQRENERILMLGKENEDVLNEKPITDQLPKVPYLSHLGNRAARFGRYHSVSTTADVIINLGHDIFFANSSHCSAYPEATEMERRASIAYSEPRKAQQYFECVTCMCCVKALFYHGTKGCEFERDWSDEPCTCKVPGKECVARWSILGVLSVFMPCVLCYPICKGC